MNIRKIDNPFAFIIFGASGDLAQLKIFPALYSLAEQKRLPTEYTIVGFARTQFSQESFKELFAQSIRQKLKHEINEDLLASLLEHVCYVNGNYDDPHSYQNLKAAIVEKDQGRGWQKLVYLAIPPQLFGVTAKNFGALRERDGEIKLILEKPLGTDAASARHLFHEIGLHFNESEIYLLDHYLGKEAIQSILSLRYANRMLNHMLSGKEIANIQITAFEELGVGKRLGYFDTVGIIKDMVQSHLLQVLALITMAIPVKETAESFQREKENILSALHFADKKKNSLVVGQYHSYQKESEQVANSQTETFAALTLFIDKLDWYNVPIFIRTGKKLAKRRTEVVIEFKKLPFQKENLEPNRLILNIQPEEKIEIQLLNKMGGSNMHFRTLSTSDSLACFGDDCLPEHGRLLMDALRGERMFFLSFHEVLASWDLIDEIIAFGKSQNLPLISYPDGSSDVEDSHKIPAAYGFKWY